MKRKYKHTQYGNTNKNDTEEHKALIPIYVPYGAPFQNEPHVKIFEALATIAFSEHVQCSVQMTIDLVTILHGQVNIIEFLTFTVHSYPLTRYLAFATKRTVR
jgi:hypothetical protein